MFDFDEIIRQAQNGDAADNLAKTFDLTQQQTQAALDVMLPAMAEGFRRNADNMNQMAGFVDSLQGGRHTDYFQNAANAFGPNARGDGNDILGQIFGSKDMSRAVAGQTAAFAGIGSDIVRKMLPIVASILAGGMQKQAQASNPLEAILKQMGSAMAGQTGAGHPGRGASERGPADAGNPFGTMLEGFFKQMNGGQSAGGANFDRSRHSDSADNMSGGFGGLVEEMFRTGRKVQDSQTEALGRIFEEFGKHRR